MTDDFALWTAELAERPRYVPPVPAPLPEYPPPPTVEDLRRAREAEEARRREAERLRAEAARRLQLREAERFLVRRLERAVAGVFRRHELGPRR